MLQPKPRCPRALRDAALGVLVATALLLVGTERSLAAPRLRDLVFDPPAVTLAPGETRPLRVLGVYDDGSQVDLTAQVTFESRDLAVVEVTGSQALARGSGSTTIRAKHPPTGVDADDPLEVTVPQILSLAIAPAETTLAPGETGRIRALATLTDGRSGIDVSGVVEWESSKQDVATVVAGQVAALRTGDAEMKVKDRSSGTRSEKNSAFVRVRTGPGGGEPPPPAPGLVAVEASPQAISLLPGETLNLSVIARLQDGSTRDVTSECSFESTRASSVAVEPSGRVTALAAGAVAIRVKHSSGKRATRDPQIWVGELTEIALALSAPRLPIGETIPLRALGVYDNGRSRELTEELTWSSSHTGVLTVSDAPGTRGLATGVGVGRAVVTARDRASGVQSRRSGGEIDVTGSGPGGGGDPIDPRDIQALSIEPTEIRIFPEDSQPLRVFALLRDGSTVEVTDSVSLRVKDTRVATLEGTTLRAIAPGQTEITAEEPVSRKRSRTAARLHVPRLVALEIEPARLALGIAGTASLRALARLDDGSRGVDVTDRVRWTSSNPAVLTVDDREAKGWIRGEAKGSVAVRAQDPLSGRSSDGSTGRVDVGGAVPSASAEIVALHFAPTELALTPGERRAFTVRGVLADGTEVDLPPSDLKSRSVDRRIASLGRDNEVTGRRGGFGEIAVQHRPSGVSASLPLAVRDISRIEIEPANILLRPGETGDLRAWASFTDGSPRRDVTDAVAWRSADRAVAATDGGVLGRVQAVRDGTTLIEAAHRLSRVHSDDTTGRVRVVGELARLLVDPPRATLAPGDQSSFRALGVLADGSVVDLSTKVQWSTIDPRIGTVDAVGRVRALFLGEFRVRVVDPLTGVASSDPVTGTSGDDAIVSVRDAGLDALQVTATKAFTTSPVEVRIAAGETQALFALGRILGSAQPQDLTARVLWQSSQPEIATVSRGLVGCIAQGMATVSARDPATGISSTGTLGDATVVCAGDILALRIDPSSVDLDFSKSRQMRAYRIFSDGHEVDVTRRVRWTSSHPQGVSIVETGTTGGMATAHDDVVATISALDTAFGVRSSDPGGNDARIAVRKTRTKLEIFPIYPTASPDGVFRGHVSELARLRARVTYKSGATQGVNLLVDWKSSDPSVVQMGDGTGEIAINQGLMLKPGVVTITATWPADEFSPTLSAQITVEVLP